MHSFFEFEVVPLTDAIANRSAFDSEVRRPVVLVVDDEPLIADTLAAILTKCGFVAFAAYDGPSALETAGVVPPEVLITDVRMPGMSGIDLGIALSQAVPDCKVLLFSAHAPAAELNKARQAGFDFPLLAKPIHPAEMLLHVAQCLDFRPLPIAASPSVHPATA